jgi:hypothetical protein
MTPKQCTSNSILKFSDCPWKSCARAFVCFLKAKSSPLFTTALPGLIVMRSATEKIYQYSVIHFHTLFLFTPPGPRINKVHFRGVNQLVRCAKSTSCSTHSKGHTDVPPRFLNRIKIIIFLFCIPLKMCLGRLE